MHSVIHIVDLVTKAWDQYVGRYVHPILLIREHFVGSYLILTVKVVVAQKVVAAVIVELVIQIMDVHVVKLENQSQKIHMDVLLVYQ